MAYRSQKTFFKTTTALASASALFLTAPAVANGVSLNYDSLASLEEPLATEIGDVTLSLNGLLDMPLSLDFENDDDFDIGFIGNYQVSAETQLDNRWTVGVASQLPGVVLKVLPNECGRGFAGERVSGAPAPVTGGGQ